MSVTSPQETEPALHQQRPAYVFMRIKAWLGDHSDSSRAQRAAGIAFLIRVASAALLYVSQVLFARWMGSFEFGVYVYVWTWVLLLGGLVDLGIATGTQRFIPEYIGRKQLEMLRGFLSGSRWLVLAMATAWAGLAALGVTCSALIFIPTRSCRSTSPASACRCSRSAACRTAWRARSTGSISR